MASNIFYVYHLIDPRTNLPFYVGKGKGDRDVDHLRRRTIGENPYRDHVIEQIRRSGLEPTAVRVHEGLDEKTAYELEEIEIKRYGRRRFDEDGILTNSCLDARPPSAKGRPPGPKTMERMRTNNPHKSGAESHRLGVKHSEDARKRISEGNKSSWAAIPKEERAARNKKAWETRRRRISP